MNFEDVFSHKKTIRHVVETGYMPPWYANESKVQYANSLSLTKDEIELLREWYNGGCEQGDSSDFVFQEAIIGSEPSIFPEYIDYFMPETYELEASHKDRYLRVTMFPKTPMENDMELVGVEFFPQNKNVVHHAELYAVSGSNLIDSLQLLSDFFFLEDGGVMPGERYRFISSWLPGQDIDVFPKGTIKKISSEETPVLLVHYAPFPIVQRDSTRIRFHLKPQSEDYQEPYESVELTVIDQFAWNPSKVFVPAGEKVEKVVEQKVEIESDVSLFALHPHAHQLCTSMWAVMISPHGDTIPLLDLPKWDFDWQHFYRFQKYIKMEKGSRVLFKATYDNTERNPENPNHPPKDVFSSFRTDDEMMVLFILAKPYEQGDELIDVEYPKLEGP